MSRLIFFFFVSWLISQTAIAQTVYLKYDDSCIDKMEYATPSGAVPYISYAVRSADNRMVIFDAGLEGGKGTKDLQAKLVSCRDLLMDKMFVERINSGAVKIVLVKETAEYYQLNAVDKAVYIAQNKNVIEFSSPDADFMLNTENLASDVNLAGPTSQSEVYLDGTLRTQCTTGYILRKKAKQQAEAYKEFTLIPGIGIIEKKAVTNSGTAAANSLKLSKINNQGYWDYLTAFCDSRQASYYETKNQAKPSEYSDLVNKVGTDIPKNYDSGDPCAPSTIEGIHTVQKGETLYGISRRYGVTIDQLRNWNNLDASNLIKICQKINVKPPSASTPSTGTSTVQTEKGTTTIPSGGYWLAAPDVHVVRQGETVAMLANMYGYTEERFRKMNSLSLSEVVYPGQKLHTSDCICPTLESTTKDVPLPYEVETPVITSKVNNDDVYFRPIKVHLVQQNETLFSIAQLYSTTPERIVELNGLKKGEGIKPNQRLYVQ